MKGSAGQGARQLREQLQQGESGRPGQAARPAGERGALGAAARQGIALIHEEFARAAARVLVRHARTVASLRVVGIRELDTRAYLARLPDPAVVVVARLGPGEARLLLGLDGALVTALVERALGGPGTGAGGAEHRPLTEIEASVIRRVAGELLPLYGRAWSAALSLHPRFVRLAADPRSLEVFLPDQRWVVTDLAGRVGRAIGRVTVALPRSLLAPALEKLAAPGDFRGRGAAGAGGLPRLDRQRLAAVRERVARTPVPVSVLLGEATLTVHELLGLTVGDVIRLDRPAGAPVVVRVGERARFLACPGLLGGRVAVEILGVLEEVHGGVERESSLTGRDPGVAR